MLEDTIAAIATPLGAGGLAVVRLSGPQSLSIADQCFEPVGKSSLKPSEAATHTIHYGRVVHKAKLVDEVLLAVMRAPRTFTREDVVETRRRLLQPDAQRSALDQPAPVPCRSHQAHSVQQ